MHIQGREPKLRESFEGPQTLKLFSPCSNCKVAAIQASVNRDRLLIFDPTFKQISLSEAPTNCTEQVLCIDRSQAKGNT